MTPLRKRMAIVVAGIAAGLAMLLALPSVAFAQTDEGPERTDDSAAETDEAREAEHRRRFEEAKKHIMAEIDKRLEVLSRLTETVESSGHITDAHADKLLADYRNATAILVDGKAAVEAAESLGELMEVAPAVFEKTLVFALLVPKTHLVVASDTIVDVTERFDEAGGHLQGIIDELSAMGLDMTTAQQELDAFDALVAEAVATAEPVADAVIDLEPEDGYEVIEAAIRAGKADLEEAHSLLRQAREQAHNVVKAIREALPDGGSDEG